MNKVKFEIKNKWTGSVLFEYEKEDNTLKKTVEKAVKEGANLGGADLEGADLEGAYLRGADLEGADLEGANLRGADLRGVNLKGVNLKGAYLRGVNLKGVNLKGAYLRGAYLEGAYIYLDDNEINVEEIIKDFEEKNNIKITEWYINKKVIPTRWNAFWRYGLIVCSFEIKEEVVEKMTLSQVCKELGRNVKIIKEN